VPKNKKLKKLLRYIWLQTLAARVLEELFSGCAVVSVFWLWWEIVLGVITYHTVRLTSIYHPVPEN
jgi:hypothetical protein